MQQLGAYDYNLTGSVGYHPQASYRYQSNRYEVSQYDQLLQQLSSIDVDGVLSIGDPVFDDVLQSYEEQYTSEGAANARVAAIATVTAKLQLAQSQNRGISMLSVSHPDGTRIRGSMVQDLNATQSAHYTALYNQDHTRWMGYDSTMLSHLGLNPLLSQGELADGQSVVNDYADPATDEAVQEYTTRLDDAQATLQVLNQAPPETDTGEVAPTPDTTAGAAGDQGSQ